MSTPTSTAGTRWNSRRGKLIATPFASYEQSLRDDLGRVLAGRDFDFDRDVTALYLYLKNGNDIGGGNAVLTGPSFVDKNNIDTILPFAKNNTR